MSGTRLTRGFRLLGAGHAASPDEGHTSDNRSYKQDVTGSIPVVPTP